MNSSNVLIKMKFIQVMETYGRHKQTKIHFVSKVLKNYRIFKLILYYFSVDRIIIQINT